MSLYENSNLSSKDIILVQIQRDFEHCESSGASGMFQVVSITLVYKNGMNEYRTDLIDQGDMFNDAEEVLKKLGLASKNVQVEYV